MPYLRRTTRKAILHDVVTQINIRHRHRCHSVLLDYNKITIELVAILYALGIIRGFRMNYRARLIKVLLRYNGGFHIFYKLVIVSKPSKKIFWNLRKIYLKAGNTNGYIYIISTKEGLVLASDCIWRRLTGEVLLKLML